MKRPMYRGNYPKIWPKSTTQLLFFRKQNSETSPLFKCAVCCDFSAVVFDDLLADGETYAATLILAMAM